MATLLTASMLRRISLGRVVERAAAVLPATTQTAYYTIAGGRVMITAFVGEFTVAASGTATNLTLVGNPTTGTDVNLCTATAITSKELGTLFGPTGLFSDALNVANAGALSGFSRPIILPVGTLDFLTSATNTGQTKSWLTYIPIDDGATVVAA